MLVHHTMHTIRIPWHTGKAKEENKVVKSNIIFLAVRKIFSSQFSWALSFSDLPQKQLESRSAVML